MSTVLVIGSGGREHVLVSELAKSKGVTRVVAAPGNPGMSEVAELRPVDPLDTDAILELAGEIAPDLIVVGPEAPIAAGLSDKLSEAHFCTFAPSRDAARLEWDKSFAKGFMRRHGIPTASYAKFAETTIAEGEEYLRNHSLPVVIKSAGLAAGKGVMIHDGVDEALVSLRAMLSGERFGEAGKEVVVEEFLSGEEASIFVVTDGTDYTILSSSQDHKRVGEGDTGLNTGGMGAYAPAPIVTDEVMGQIRRDIIEPTLQGMREEGSPYAGCLYVGVMIENDKPRVVEFNCRFGDPEAQVILPLFQGNLFQLFCSAAEGTLGKTEWAESSGTGVCVVVASGGYPEAYEKGKKIDGLKSAEMLEGVSVYHAGTRSENDEVMTNGGRVLGVTAISSGDDLKETIERAYEGVREITFENMYYRRDIGHKGVGK